MSSRDREPGQHRRQVAADFGISESCLTNWLAKADVEDGVRPGTTSEDDADLREAERRIRLPEQENEVLRRAAAYISQGEPAGRMMFLREREVPPPLVRELAAPLSQLRENRADCRDAGQYAARCLSSRSTGKRRDARTGLV
ncbi:hypothetical protein [Janibacter sp. UYMM211]|uniref:hypothetical protein n=1 Tax=Janibacter sp. UYMM211 TaxID=3156342 RepID=UPI003393F1C4